jgi:hypothetical protein
MIENRRNFLAQSSLFASFAISGTKSSGKIIGANERINVAVCGIKGRGTSHMGGHGRQKNVVISHLVDPDTRLHEARKKFIASKFKNMHRMCTGCTQCFGQQGSGCYFNRHSQSLAQFNVHMGLPSRQRCLCGKTIKS